MKTIILDHDIGTNPDDFFALLLLLNSPEVSLAMTISGNNFPLERAQMMGHILAKSGNEHIPSYVGEKTGTIDFYGQRYQSDLVVEDSYIEAVKRIIESSNEVVYLCIQGMSNLATFLNTYPMYQDAFTVVHMGMRRPTEIYSSGGTNMEADLNAAHFVYQLGLKKLFVVGGHTTTQDAIRVTPQTTLYKKLETSTEPLHRMLFADLLAFYERRGIWPALHDPLATSVALGREYVTFDDVAVTFRDDGWYQIDGQTNVLLSNDIIHDYQGFMELCTERI